VRCRSKKKKNAEGFQSKVLRRCLTRDEVRKKTKKHHAKGGPLGNEDVIGKRGVRYLGVPKGFTRGDSVKIPRNKADCENGVRGQRQGFGVCVTCDKPASQNKGVLLARCSKRGGKNRLAMGEWTTSGQKGNGATRTETGGPPGKGGGFGGGKTLAFREVKTGRERGEEYGKTTNRRRGVRRNMGKIPGTDKKKII